MSKRNRFNPFRYIFSIEKEDCNKIIRILGLKIKHFNQRQVFSNLQGVFKSIFDKLGFISGLQEEQVLQNKTNFEDLKNTVKTQSSNIENLISRIDTSRNKSFAYLGIKDNVPDSFKDYLLKNNMPEKIAALKNGLDEKSVQLLDRTLTKIINLPDWEYAKYLYCNENEFKKVFNTDTERDFEILVNNSYYPVKSKYKLAKDDYDMEVFLFHHGLLKASNKIKEYIKNKDIIDAGAFIGDSALVFLQYCPNKIYSFEITNENIDFYKKTMELNNVPTDKYELNQFALADKEEEFTVSDIDGMSGNIYCSLGYSVKSVTLDAFLKDKDVNIGFIKADVEGAMLKMLKGMRETIQKYRPVLSLSIYHSPEEFFEVKPLLDEIVKDLNYTIELDNHFPSCMHIYGTVLWAYPSELE